MKKYKHHNLHLRHNFFFTFFSSSHPVLNTTRRMACSVSGATPHRMLHRRRIPDVAVGR
jgi:hypothetical protein